MKIAILTIADFAATAQRIGGPQATVVTRAEALPREVELLLIFLHPAADGQAWLDEAQAPVLTVEQVAGLPLAPGAIVFVGACYGMENQALLSALQQAGAGALIAGPGVNYGSQTGLSGADTLALALRTLLQGGLPLPVAWSMARGLVRLAAGRGLPGAADALEYQILGVQHGEFWRGLVGTLGGLVTLLAFLIALFTGQWAPGPLVTFSSVPNPPAPITAWEKLVYDNGDEVGWALPVALLPGEILQVVDVVTPTVGADFNLLESWDTGVISLTAVSADSGAVVPGSGVLTWTVAGASGSATMITKTWVTLGGWSSSALMERLISGGETTTVTVALSNDATPTPTVTPTPRYTPRPWPTISYPTPTPCAGLGCGGGAGIAYQLFLPVILNDQ